MSYFARIESLVETISVEGLYRGKTAKAYHILGRRAGFTSTSVLNDVKEYDNGVAAIPTFAGTEGLEVVSSSVNDAAAGSGVRTIKIVYIDTSDNMVESSAITLNGTTAVAVAFNVHAILWMEAVTVGTAGTVAAGNIVLRNSTDHTTEYERITAGGNRSLTAFFMVPTGYTGYLVSWDAHCVNNDQDARLRVTCDTFDRSLTTDVYKFMGNMYLASNTGSEEGDLGFMKCPALSKIKVSTLSAATGAGVRLDTSFLIIIVAN